MPADVRRVRLRACLVVSVRWTGQIGSVVGSIINTRMLVVVAPKGLGVK